ncbi:MAG: hypothetical protein ACRD6X_21395, partial [Pyrinomonadaceae bacterium]
MNVGTSNPDNQVPEVVDPDNYWHPFIGGGAGGALGNWGCRLVGINLPCSVGYRILGSDGGVIQRSWDNIPVRYNGQTVWAWFTATADGYSGYIPTNATYIGGGRIQPIGYGGPPRFSPSRGNSPPDTNIGQLNGVTDLSERDLLQNAPQPQQEHWNPRFITHLDNPSENFLAQRILGIAQYARDSKECAEAFKSVGAVPIGDQIINTTIVTQNVFSDPRYDSSWVPDDGGKFADALRKRLASETSYFGIVGPSDITQEGEYMSRRFIGLTTTGIKETKFKLATTIIHSFLHSGGVPKYEGWFNTSPNDLNISNEKHAEIIEKCTKK